jgi:hypothetical protein
MRSRPPSIDGKISKRAWTLESVFGQERQGTMRLKAACVSSHFW